MLFRSATGASFTPSASSFGTGAFQIYQTNGLQTVLNNKQSNVYALPDTTTNQWTILGNLATAQTGNTTKITIVSNSGYTGQPWLEARAELQFSTSDGTNWYQNGNDGAHFYGACTMISTNNIPASSIAILQNTSTSYSFYYYAPYQCGNTWFKVETLGAWAYYGTASSPSGCYINPQQVYSYSLDSSNNCNFWVSTIRSIYFQSQTVAWDSMTILAPV